MSKPTTREAELWYALETAIKLLSVASGGRIRKFKDANAWMSHLRHTGQLANPENLSPHTTQNQTQDETNN